MPRAEPLTAPQDRLIGVELPGGYVLQEYVGGGGMGRVYRAEQIALGRNVAVKVVHPHLLYDEDVPRRFLNEARVASRLNHPNSIAIIDFGRTETGLHYLVMEYLRGRDLARVLTERGALGVPRSLDIMLQLLDVLSEAHPLGIVHLDLKPENIVLETTRSGADFVKVVDFGLAKLLDPSRISTRGSMNAICGTPDYMSPEQCRGERPDARSDLYAVGIILYLLLTERLPFTGDTATQVLLNQLTKTAPDPRTYPQARDLPDSLVGALFRALDKRPEERFQSAQEFSESLRQVLAQLAGDRREQGVRRMTCAACGAQVPARQKFCGECGVRTPWEDSLLPPARAARPTVNLPFPLLGRDDDLAWLAERLAAAAREPSFASVAGPIGVGRTRLLEAFAASARRAGHRVALAGPDPWSVGVPCHATRVLLRNLLGADLDPFDPALEGASDAVRIGLSDAFFGQVPLDTPPLARRASLAEALRWGIERAYALFGPAPVVCILDDADRVDDASRAALADLATRPPLAPVLVLLAATAPRQPLLLAPSAIRTLGPLDATLAQRLLAGSHGAQLLAKAAPDAPALPMVLEQLVRYCRDGGDDAPTRLGDLVAARIARLDASKRRVVQALSVLGDLATVQDVSAVLATTAGVDVVQTVAALLEQGWVERDADHVRIAHPLVRDIVEGTIPAAVSRELHHAVAERLAGRSIPLAARAHYLEKAGDVFGALVLLERMGDEALARDDSEFAAHSFRRGLDVARRCDADELMGDPMHTVALFGRKLGEALMRAGQLHEAEGVLAEAVAFTTTADERHKLLFARARIAGLRGRRAEALELVNLAVELAREAGGQELAHRLQREAREWLG